MRFALKIQSLDVFMKIRYQVALLNAWCFYENLIPIFDLKALNVLNKIRRRSLLPKVWHFSWNFDTVLLPKLDVFRKIRNWNLLPKTWCSNENSLLSFFLQNLVFHENLTLRFAFKSLSLSLFTLILEKNCYFFRAWKILTPVHLVFFRAYQFFY